MRIDSHQHFWYYESIRDNKWLTGGYEMLRRNYGPQDLNPHLIQHKLDGSIVVQHMNNSIVNQQYLELAKDNKSILGIVGWVDLCAPNIQEQLTEYANIKLIKGFRHLVQNEPDPQFMLQDSFLNGISYLGQYDLSYDFLVFPHQLQAAIEVARLFPQQRFVLDHIAKPKIASGIIDKTWIKHIEQLAGASANVYCKLSGMNTEANWNNWNLDTLRPYIDVIVNTFGYNRIMFGSDWPVCLVAGSYESVYNSIDDYCKNLDQTQRDNIFGNTAMQFYKVKK